MNIIVLPTSWWSRMTSFCMSRRISGSSALNGSSKSITSGSTASARARPTRCCMAAGELVGVAVRVAVEADERRASRGALGERPPSGRRGSRGRTRCCRAPAGGAAGRSAGRPWRSAAGAARAASLVGLPDVVAVEEDSAGRRLDEPGEAADQRRLAAAGQAHDDEDLAGLDVERHVADGDREAGQLAEVWLDSSVGGALVIRSAGPKTFQRRRTEIVDLAGGDPSRVGPTGAAPGLVTDGSVAVGPAAPRLGATRGAAVHHAAPSRRHRPAGEPALGSRVGVLLDVLRIAVLVEAGQAKLPAEAGSAEAAHSACGM